MAAACGVPRQLGDQAPPDDASCRGCHGSVASPAPPTDLGGSSDPTRRGVGAHAIHLSGSALSGPIACQTCHEVPSSPSDPGHVDHAWPAIVRFAGTALVRGATPGVQAAAPTGDIAVDVQQPVSCSGVYCHGAGLSGGSFKQPVWNRPDSRATACDACHGNPPPAPHPTSTKCAECHAETMAPDGTIAHPEKHVDGRVEVSGGIGCNGCHGSDQNAAPPRDTGGGTTTDRLGVGAHQKHLSARLSAPVQCSECHKVPATYGEAGHDGIGPAPVTFAGRAIASSTAASWERNAATCATYCHGATLGGGSNKSPVWNKVDGTQAACGTCHGLPPPAPHPAATSLTQCASCHAETMAADGTLAHPEKHIDGTVQAIGGTCNSCHGSAANDAPPKDTQGNTSTTALTVGAHQAHLGATLATRVSCNECHQVPSAFGQPGHDGSGPAPVNFAGRAVAQSTKPTWDRSAATCAASYCHGATLSGGSAKSPVWTRVDGSQKSCGSCHGAPPPAPHPSASSLAACVSCHNQTMAADGTIAHPDKHLDGTVEVTGGTACNSCHGSANNNAPPQDVSGGSSTTLVTVGAHQAHLGATLTNAVACSECHQVPTAFGQPGHDGSGPAPVTFTGRAVLKGSSPSWSRSGATCASTYCHGSTLSEGSSSTPLWTRVDGSQKSCGSCHGYPPATGRHGDHGFDCGRCHGGVVSNGQILDRSRHINGAVDVSISGGTYNSSTGSCSPGCHSTRTW